MLVLSFPLLEKMRANYGRTVDSVIVGIIMEPSEAEGVHSFFLKGLSLLANLGKKPLGSLDFSGRGFLG